MEAFLVWALLIIGGISLFNAIFITLIYVNHTVDLEQLRQDIKKIKNYIGV